MQIALTIEDMSIESLRAIAYALLNDADGKNVESFEI
jgi:hypothetical protein